MDLPYISDVSLNDFISKSIAEDVGEGDHSSLASIASTKRSIAKLVIKGDGIIAGIQMASHIFSFYDQGLRMKLLKNDGDQVKNEEVAFFVEGNTRSILSTERLVLNCMQRMSGIATYTHHLNLLIKGTKANLLDTRKTTPLFRLAEKWAVAIGGGINHRFGLFDMIMLKDNHMDFAGGISKAILKTKKYLKENKLNLKVVVEARNLEEVKEALAAGGVFRILLDNMLPAQIKEAVQVIGGKVETEASGGITEENIAEIAATGVDYISVGGTYTFL